MDAPGISVASLRRDLSSSRPPIVIDVRRHATFSDAPDLIQGALRRNPLRVDAWAKALPAAADIVVYCVHGHEVSQGVAKSLGARYLQGGIEAWRDAGGEFFGKPRGASSRWVTRERPKIDRIACPWLLRRFIDPDAEFLYVPAADVRRIAADREAVPYDVPDVNFSHDGPHCSFDAFVAAYRLHEPALDALALIVRGADTGRLELSAQAPGLLAISLGLSRLYEDDHEMLEHGIDVYDALYAWCRESRPESHTWNLARFR